MTEKWKGILLQDEKGEPVQVQSQRERERGREDYCPS